MPVWSFTTNRSLIIFGEAFSRNAFFRGHAACWPYSSVGDDGTVCGSLVMADDLAKHFVVVHDIIKNVASDIRVECYRYPSYLRKRVKQKSVLKHLQGVQFEVATSGGRGYAVPLRPGFVQLTPSLL